MSTPQELIGERIGQYQIKAYLDSGNVSAVYRAEDVTLRRRVALKILLPELAHNEEMVARFQREARALARLQHPNIVQVFAISDVTLNGVERPYIAMQYVAGNTLAERLDQLQEPMQPLTALLIVRQIADAVSLMHRAGIIHRDIKPANILLRTKDTAPFLADLGLASMAADTRLTQTGAALGTPAYMAPEQISSDEPDPRSDIYALGVVLYEMLAGERPFRGDDTNALYQQHLQAMPRPIEQHRPDLTMETSEVVRRCLAKDPVDRWQSAAELVDALDNAILSAGGEPPGAAFAWETTGTESVVRRSDVVQPVTPVVTRPRPPWLRYGVVALVLLGVVVGAFLALPPLRGIFATGGTPVVPTAVVVTAPPEPATAVVIIATSTLAPPPTQTPTPLPTETPTVAPTATPNLGPVEIEIGQSVEERPLVAVRFGDGDNVVLFIGGLHAGAAPSTVTLAEEAIEYFSENPEEIPPTVTLYVIPNANPDSQEAIGEVDGRLNANGVDLNRNWDCRWIEDATFRGVEVPGSGGPAQFSEPESKALQEFVLDTQPSAVVFWEARASGGLSSPGACSERSQVSEPLSRRYGNAAGYKVADFEEYSGTVINGDATNWLDTQGFPAIAVLLPDYDVIDWENNLAGMQAVLSFYEED